MSKYENIAEWRYLLAQKVQKHRMALSKLLFWIELKVNLNERAANKLVPSFQRWVQLSTINLKSIAAY